MVDVHAASVSRKSFPVQQILGVSFFADNLDAAIRHSLLGGLVLAPSGPGLANDLPRDLSYAKALAVADLVLPDSGLMILWWNCFRPSGLARLDRLSGLHFLKEILMREAQGLMQSSFWIMPDAAQDVANRDWLCREMGIPVDKSDVYLAPRYSQSGPIVDEALLGRLVENQCKIIVVSLGGGVQERLGHFLRDNLSWEPTILCTGAALAFLSGQQVRIPRWADRLYLGWLLRCFAQPSRFIPRYWAARKLVRLLRRFGPDSPCPQEMSGVGEPA